MKIHPKDAIEKKDFGEIDEFAKINGVSAVIILEGFL